MRADRRRPTCPHGRHGGRGAARAGRHPRRPGRRLPVRPVPDVQHPRRPRRRRPVDARVEAVDAPGRLRVVDEPATGLKRAEVEGQVARFVADPALLGALAEAHAGCSPTTRPSSSCGSCERRYRLRDSRPDRATRRRPSSRAWTRVVSRLRWPFAPAPLARVAVLRVIAYLFVPVDVLLTTTFVRGPRLGAARALRPAAHRPAAAAAGARAVGRGRSRSCSSPRPRRRGRRRPGPPAAADRLAGRGAVPRVDGRGDELRQGRPRPVRLPGAAVRAAERRARPPALDRAHRGRRLGAVDGGARGRRDVLPRGVRPSSASAAGTGRTARR